MAEAIVSAVAEQLVSIITTQIQSEIHLVRGVDKELLDLSDKLKNIRNVLDDADMKQFKEKTVKDWLWRLEQTSYEMEDVLDEWNYAILQHKIQSQSQSAASSNRKVRSFIPCSCFCFKKLVVRHDIAKKIQNLKSRLDLILNEKDVYNFVISHPQNDPSPASWRVQSTSLIDLEEVQGRNYDRDILVSKLCANGGGHERLGYRVLSIVGAGGLGKTTLAQLLFNDSQVKECFDLRIWICVSDPFDVAAIAKEIMERIKEGSSPNTNQLDALVQGLIRSISGKRILLVLDDVWTEEYVKWEPLQNALKCGGAGSKILVTTRKVNVAKIMSTIDEDIHNLELLSEEDCWLLLRRLALLGRSEKEFEKFEEVGKDIAKKCNGLPLAAKTLGSLLRFKNRVEEWESVLKSEMWGLEQVKVELFPHLLLSYHELSPMLKCCFSYCALFRKDKRIKVEKLIRLWMASGYIGSAGDEMELKGREYFEDLAMRSLFLDFERDGRTGLIVSCKMHDIVHDFAQFMRKKNDREEASGVTNTSCKVCDPFLVSQLKEYRSLFWGEETLPNHCGYCLKSLRVLKIEGGVNGNLSGIKTLIHLRWLDVTHKRLLEEELKTICELYFLQTLELVGCDLKEIPREIGNLVKLRHLNLSWNRELKELSESIENLVELQTLLLERCSLTEIPKEIGNLVMLRYLNLSWNVELKELPKSIGNLVELRTLELAHCALTEIPKEIGNLVRLRHLSLSWNEELKELPESIGNLIELQHLDLGYNLELKELPESVCNLVELQTLHVDGRVLPKGIEELSELRELEGEFKVGSGDNKLGMLKKLNHLTRSLNLMIDVRSGRDLEVEGLIRLWMASGYLGSNIGSAGDEMELKGREYFEDLAMRSLFQDFEKDDETDLIVSCKMHDIVHDFAQFMRKKNDREEASGVTNTSCKVCDHFIVSRVKEYRSLFWGEETLPNHCGYCLKSLRVLKIKRGVNGDLSGIKTFIHLRWLNVSGKSLLKEEVKTICELYFLQTLFLECCSLTEIPKEIGNLVRLTHLDSRLNLELKELPESIGNLVELQTLLLNDCLLTEIPKEIGNLVRLRHLDLSGNGEFKELPESIGNLVELQTLLLNDCFLTEIPKEIGNLVELRTLLLVRCSLTEIPKEIGNLVRLRHLDSRRNRELKELPESMCNLVELQTLHVDEHVLPKGIGGLSELRELVGWFRVGSGHNKLGMLKKLNHLTGSLYLYIDVSSGRDLEELVEDAGEAELKNKIHLQRLTMYFVGYPMGISESVSSSLWVDVIEALEPSHNLKQLTINRYKGCRLPHWISSPLNLLTFIQLDHLTEVRSLPALGKLPFLEDLRMCQLDELKVVGGEWLGINMTPSSSTTAAVVAFPKLKRLEFWDCEKWEEWGDITAEEEESAALHLMPSLAELSIGSCERLKMLPHRLLRKAESLQLLDVSDSSELIKRYEDKDGEAWRSISQTHPQLRLQTTW